MRLARRLTPFQDVHHSGPAEVNREGPKTGLLEYRPRFARVQKSRRETTSPRLVRSLQAEPAWCGRFKDWVCHGKPQSADCAS
jgi:hypothetical protein